MIYTASVLILAALQVADVWLTRRLIALGGIETHPIILLFMRLLGAAAMIAAFWRFGEQPATWFGLGMMLGVYGMTILSLQIEMRWQKAINARRSK